MCGEILWKKVWTICATDYAVNEFLPVLWCICVCVYVYIYIYIYIS